MQSTEVIKLKYPKFPVSCIPDMSATIDRAPTMRAVPVMMHVVMRVVM